MTSDPTQPVPEPETFRSHLPAIAATAAGTVLAAVLGSLIGVAGMAIGSLVSGTCAWWAERGIRRSAAITAARAAAIRARGRPLRPGEDAALTQAAAARHHRGRPRRWAGPAALAVAAFIGCAVAVTVVEQAAGKPLSALVQGTPGRRPHCRAGRPRARHSPARPARDPGRLAQPHLVTHGCASRGHVPARGARRRQRHRAGSGGRGGRRGDGRHRRDLTAADVGEAA